MRNLIYSAETKCGTSRLAYKIYNTMKDRQGLINRLAYKIYNTMKDRQGLIKVFCGINKLTFHYYLTLVNLF